MGPGRRTRAIRTLDAATGDTGTATFDTGAAALEFALVAPLLFILLFGIFGAGWGLWEYQAARATTQEATRLAAVGIPDLAGYQRAIACLGERNGMRPGALTRIDLGFRGSATTLDTPVAAMVGGYVQVTLTYLSSIQDLPLADWAFTDAEGRFSTTAVTRIEQVGSSSGVTTDQVIPVNSGVCP